MWGAPRERPEGSQLERRKAILTSHHTAGWVSWAGPKLSLTGSFRSWGVSTRGPGIQGDPAERHGWPELLSEDCLHSQPCSHVPRLPQRASQACAGGPGIPGQTSLESGLCPRLTDAAQAQRADRAHDSLASEKAFPGGPHVSSPCSCRDQAQQLAACGLGSQPACVHSWLRCLLAGWPWQVPYPLCASFLRVSLAESW